MTDSIAEQHRPLLEAMSFAARAHQGQFRKDRCTPYVSHVYRVCLVLRHVFEVADPRILTAAVLHDTIEDTNTDFDDLKEQFDAEIAGWVEQLSKDKRKPFEQREKAYCETLAAAPWQVQVCKLADIFDNMLDMGYLQPEKRPQALKNKHRYLKAIESNLKPEAFKAWQITHLLYEQLLKQVADGNSA
jgi:guanosine-3',5'-bis(diphosphate) 3'-pyrophosphohydrolase